MKIVTGTISHETNVYSNIRTDLEEFKKQRLLYGDEYFKDFDGTKSPAGGIIEGSGFSVQMKIHAGLKAAFLNSEH